MRKFSLTFQIAGLLILLSVVGTWINYSQNAHIIKRVLQDSDRNRVESVVHTVESLIADNSKSMLYLSRALRTHGGIIQAMADYLRSGNVSSVHDVLRNNFPQLGATTVSVIDRNGILLFDVERAQSIGKKINLRGLEEALDGKELTVSLKEKLQGFSVRVVAPIKLTDGKIAGALVVGTRYDNVFTKRLALEVNAEVSFATIHGVWASSLARSGKHPTVDAATIAKSINDRSGIYVEDSAPDIARFFIPLRIVDETVTLIVQMDTRASRLLMQENEDYLYMISVAMVLISTLLGAGFAFLMTRPLRRMQHDSHRLTQEYGVSPANGSPGGNEVDATVTALQTATRLLAQHANESLHAKEAAEFAAQYDVLTKLPNRFLMQDRLRQALTVAERNQGQVALLFIDLDHFKTINDSLGHQVGDAVLVEVATRLRGCVREQDTVARLGGDEFVVILPNPNEPWNASVVARNIVALLDSPSSATGNDLHVSASVGIGIYPLDAANADDLMKCADAAMYQAKSDGRNGYQFFATEMNASANEALFLESGLRHALIHNEFELYYQPQFDMVAKKIIGAEALLRWHHPERGLMGPGKFIRVAEQRGLIAQIGEWVLRAACRQNRAWQDEGLPPIPVSVNVSPLQFRKQELPEIVSAILRDSGLAPQYLDLEITEGALMHDTDMTNLSVNALESMGLTLSIDDFGTGYSSLGYLKRLPFTKVKIDQSFVGALPGAEDDAAIVCAVIAMAYSLKLDVIAEGVETEAQVNFLLAAGCNKAQGYYYGRPLPVAEFRALLSLPLHAADNADA